MLNYFLEHGADWHREEVLSAAAAAGHIRVLEWMRESSYFTPIPELCNSAAEAGHLDVLQWLNPHCPWTTETAVCAAVGGHMEILYWMSSIGRYS
jgi:hypothetical protein